MVLVTTDQYQCDSYQVHDLLESHSKCDHDGSGLIHDGPVLGVVVLQQICQQFLLIGAATTALNRTRLSLRCCAMPCIENIEYNETFSLPAICYLIMCWADMFPRLQSEMCNRIFPGGAVKSPWLKWGFTTLKFRICGFKFADEFDWMWHCGRALQCHRSHTYFVNINPRPGAQTDSGLF